MPLCSPGGRFVSSSQDGGVELGRSRGVLDGKDVSDQLVLVQGIG